MAKPAHISVKSITTLVLVTAVLHAYVASRLLTALPMGVATFVGLWLCLSTWIIPISLATPYIVSNGWRDRLAWLGYTAMGVFSTLILLTLLRDLIGLGVSFWPAQVSGWQPKYIDYSYWSAWLVIGATGVLSVWGFVNSQRFPQLREVELPIDHLPAEFEDFSLVQISDLHVGPTIKRSFVQKLVNQVNQLNPDVIVLTGDLVDGKVPDLAQDIAPLAQLQARDGVYAVTGNHDYYSGIHHWLPEYQRLGLRMLMNEHVLIRRAQQQLVLAGITDYDAAKFCAAHQSDPQQALRGAPDHSVVKILLAHQPRSVFAALDAGFDIQISGHTHGGQFWPWGWLVPLQQPYVAGLIRHHSLWLYISRGTGYWGPPKRLNAPSEITRLRLKAKV